MGRALVKWTERRITERIRAGYGAGDGPDYRSWVQFGDLSSSGTTTRAYFPELGRVVLTISNLEFSAALYAVRKREMLGYQENLRLCRERTRAIAKSLGVRHPRYRGTTIDCVMTLDGLLTLDDQSGGVTKEAYDCKWSTELKKRRTRELQAILKVYCGEEGWIHRPITQNTLPRALVNNLEWIRIALPCDGEPEPVPNAFEYWPMRLHRALSADLNSKRSTAIVHAYCTDFSERHDLPVGFGLRCLKLLLWNRLAEFPIDVPDLQYQPLSVLRCVEPLSELHSIRPATPSDMCVDHACL